MATWLLIQPGGESSPAADAPGAGGGGLAPADLQKAMDSLPVPSSWTVDQKNIYTGGGVLESVFWSKTTPSEVTHAFARDMSGRGWRVTAGPSDGVAVATDKSAGGATSTVTFSDSNFTVTVTASENTEQDPSRGTTTIGVRVQRAVSAP